MTRPNQLLRAIMIFMLPALLIWSVYSYTSTLSAHPNPGVTDLLEDLKIEIASVPDEHFKSPASNRKATLINKIDAVIAQIDAGEYKGAIMKLEKDIRPKLDVNAKQTWLVAEHDELLDKIDKIIGRITYYYFP